MRCLLPPLAFCQATRPIFVMYMYATYVARIRLRLLYFETIVNHILNKHCQLTLPHAKVTDKETKESVGDIDSLGIRIARVIQRLGFRLPPTASCLFDFHHPLKANSFLWPFLRGRRQDGPRRCKGHVLSRKRVLQGVVYTSCVRCVCSRARALWHTVVAVSRFSTKTATRL